MNFLKLKKTMQEMTEETDSVDKDMTLVSPTINIDCEWFDDHVKVRDQKNGVQFTVPYEGRGEKELGSEVLSMFDYLENK